MKLLFRQPKWLSDVSLEIVEKDLFIRQPETGQIIALSFIEATVSKDIHHLP